MTNYGKRIGRRGAEADEIVSPWLTPEEAARYCAMTPPTFRRKQKLLPVPFGGCGGDENTRRYYAPVLDQWLVKLGERS